MEKKYFMDGVTVKALREVSFQIFPAEVVTIVGPSGSGKSTLLHLLGLLDKPTRGEIFFNGKATSRFDDYRLARFRNQTIGFVFQQFNLLPRTSVLENVLLPVWYHPSLEFSSATKKARELLKEFGLGERLNHFPNQLSGGEQQRTAIARALICDPQIILADEPTGNLDSKTGQEIIKLLLQLNKKWGKTLVIVTHDNQLAQVGDHRLYLKDGKIIKEKRK